jgi:hypothetical protein
MEMSPLVSSDTGALDFFFFSFFSFLAGAGAGAGEGLDSAIGDASYFSINSNS